MSDHQEPCGVAQRLDERANDAERRLGEHDAMISNLQKRLPTWAVFYQNGLTGIATALATAIYFLLRGYGI